MATQTRTQRKTRAKRNTSAKRNTRAQPPAHASRDSAVFYINGERCEAQPEVLGWMLADFLRERRRLTGTKIVCAEGDCGACSVLMARPPVAGRTAEPAFVAVNACIIRVGHCDGTSIVTVEGLGSSASLSEVQRAVCHANGSQCGFCTPGFVVALAGLADRRKAQGLVTIDERDAKNALTGNLCRCTGYAPILAGATDIALDKWGDLAASYLTKPVVAELRRVAKIPIVPLRGGVQRLDAEGFSFAAPVAWDAVGVYLRNGYRVVSGGTDVGVVANKGKPAGTKVVALHLVDGNELRKISIRGTTLTFGALVTVAALRRALQGTFPELAGFFDLFASPQIKNMATVVGNIANGSPIGDATCALMACGAEVRIEGTGKPAATKPARWLSLASLYLGYRELALRPGEWISGVRIELPTARDRVAFFKTSQRKDLDISAVNAGLWIRRGAAGKITACRLAVGGVGPTVARLPRAEYALTSLPAAALDGTDAAALEASIAATKAAAQADIAPLSDLRGSAAFRRVVLNNWLEATLRELAAGRPS